jgi:hypothetical protein
MLLAAGTWKVNVAIAIIAILLVIRLASFFDYKERAEVPTQENVIKRIAEHQGAARFGSWKVTRSVLRVGLIIAVVWVVSQIVGK